MDNKIKKTTKKFTLAYFSGTGCTKAACECFEKQLRELGFACKKLDIACSSPTQVKGTDTLIIFAPVYAFRLAFLAEEWIRKLPRTKRMKAAIISVSGGGEVSPNTACRLYSKRLLTKKGFTLIYEDMIVMPSNIAIQADAKVNYDLLVVLPKKVDKIIKDILAGKIRLTIPKLQDRLFARIGKAEHLGAVFFGATIHASSKCNQCGRCIRNCPMKNIKMVNGHPKFGFRCMWCLKCIYTCPKKALSPRALKFAVLKDGFNLEKMKKLKLEDQKTKSKSSKCIFWKGVIDYIQELK